MKMFELKKHPAKIANFNPRAEKHGDENVPAGDITVETRAHFSILDSFDPSYRTFLFRKADKGGDQQPLLKDDELIAVAKPRLQPLRLDEEFPGYTLKIESGLDIGKPLQLKDVELSNFKIEPMEGGSVAIKFTASAHPDSDVAGLLCALIQNEVDITLIPPKATPQQSLN